MNSKKKSATCTLVPIYDRVPTIIIIIKETPSVCPAPPRVTFSAPSAIKRNSTAVFNIIYMVEEAMHIKRARFDFFFSLPK